MFLCYKIATLIVVSSAIFSANFIGEKVWMIGEAEMRVPSARQKSDERPLAESEIEDMNKIAKEYSDYFCSNGQKVESVSQSYSETFGYIIRYVVRDLASGFQNIEIRYYNNSQDVKGVSFIAVDIEKL